MNRQKEYQDKYHGALDRMFDLFKYGREVEAELENKLEIARDELIRIKNVCSGQMDSDSAVYFSEIRGLCDRGLDSTRKAS